MIKIMFVCHGNICRSPMAEFILKDMVKQKGLQNDFVIRSSATSTEEIFNGIGNPVYPSAKKFLKITEFTQRANVPFSLKKATMICTICLSVWTVPISEIWKVFSAVTAKTKYINLWSTQTAAPTFPTRGTHEILTGATTIFIKAVKPCWKH